MIWIEVCGSILNAIGFGCGFVGISYLFEKEVFGNLVEEYCDHSSIRYKIQDTRTVPVSVKFTIAFF